jgi:hypothetical protein
MKIISKRDQKSLTPKKRKNKKARVVSTSTAGKDVAQFKPRMSLETNKLKMAPVARGQNKVQESVEAEVSISKPISANEPQKSKRRSNRASKFYENSCFTDMLVNEELDGYADEEEDKRQYQHAHNDDV